MWGNYNFDYACSLSRGRSGGKWTHSDDTYYMINVYGPQNSKAKAQLWYSLHIFLQDHNDARVTVLDRLSSDHNPIMFHVSKVDMGQSLSKNFTLGYIEMIWMRKQEISTLLKEIEIKLDAGRASDENKVTRVNLSHEFNDLEKFSEMNVLQKSRVKWDAEGDENTKFFHGLLKQKRRHQSIQGITVDGTWITDPHQVKSAFLNFFKAEFQETEAPVSFNSNKAPGPDGFPFFFIKNYWDLLKDDIYSFVDNFLTSGMMPPGVQYKIVVNVLATWFSKVVDKIISYEQSAFIRDRQILGGPLMMSEEMDPSCLRSARTSILVNGSPSLEFSIRRGLRQGDPFSPFLFIIVTEGLHLAINKAVQTNLIREVFVGAAEFNVSHFFFADDVIIVTEWSNHDMDNLKRILHVFHLASGLKINMLKSNGFGVGVPTDDVVVMAHGNGCEARSFPFKYLGVPIGSNMNRVDGWSHLVSKFNDMLSNWKANLLFIGGRLNLTKAVLSSVGIYHMSIFRFPETTIRTLERIRASFFWEAVKVEKNGLGQMGLGFGFS
nr:putative RNA-directed DNA polymerase, eukaryota, reverse transcriptase zinc-binding domain protein [Tanacetum cinerariifolium]